MIQELSSQLEAVHLDVEGLKKERDFYFAKVRPSLSIALRDCYWHFKFAVLGADA